MTNLLFYDKPVALDKTAHQNLRVNSASEFYEAFGFETTSTPYQEDGIPHIQMTRAAKR